MKGKIQGGRRPALNRQTLSQLDTIRIEGLRVSCIVGVYPHERETPQELEIDLAMSVDTRSAGESQKLNRTVDYAQIASQIAFILQHSRFLLLETAAHALIRYLLAPPALGEQRARILDLTLRLSKPAAFFGNGKPSLEVTRSLSDVQLEHEDSVFGSVDIVFENLEVGIYRLNVAPHKSIPLHVHRVMRESEMLLSNGLRINGQNYKAGTSFAWEKDRAHRYDNETDQWQTVLCIDSPKFIREDEIEVSESAVQTGEAKLAEVKPLKAFLPIVD